MALIINVLQTPQMRRLCLVLVLQKNKKNAD